MAKHVAVLMEGENAFIANEEGDDHPGCGGSLRTIPETGDDAAYECWKVCAESSKRCARQDRKWHARSHTGIAHEAHQKENHQRSDPNGDHKIQEAAAKKKETCGKIIAPEAMHVRCPDVENAECAPFSVFSRC